jgi:aspergillopepsin I
VNAIVDSGTTLVYLNDELADAVAKAFDPPGGLDEDLGLYTIPCGAKPPIFGASIGGKVFNVNPEDMSLQINADTCMSGIQGNHGGLWILGDVWMKAVLCVFDIGASRMGFAGRQYYGMTWDAQNY